MDRQDRQELLVTGRRETKLFRRMIIIWIGVLLAAIVLCLAELAAFGKVIHVWLAVNSVLVFFLAGAADAVIALFQAGWFRFGTTGYAFNIPWKGLRGGCNWEDVDYAALIPGNRGMKNCKIALLIVERKGTVTALEYRDGLLFSLLERYPRLRVAALRESGPVAELCRELDKRHIGWLPMTWIENEDGSGSLALKSTDAVPKNRANGRGGEMI